MTIHVSVGNLIGVGGWVWEVFTPLPTSWRSGASWVNGELVSFCSVGEEVTTVVTVVLWVSSILSVYFSKFIVTDWEGFLNSFDEVADVVNLVLAEGEDETGLGYIIVIVWSYITFEVAVYWSSFSLAGWTRSLDVILLVADCDWKSGAVPDGYGNVAAEFVGEVCTTDWHTGAALIFGSIWSSFVVAFVDFEIATDRIVIE